MPAAQTPPPDPSAPADPAPAGADAAPPAETAPDAGPAEPAADADPADVKARFRDALERKKSQHADGVGGSGPNTSKIHDVRSRAGGKRQFRRKSGG